MVIGALLGTEPYSVQRLWVCYSCLSHSRAEVSWHKRSFTWHISIVPQAFAEVNGQEGKYNNFHYFILYQLTTPTICDILGVMAGHSDDTPSKSLADPIGQTETEKLASSIIPYARDDAKARYLGLRASGFTIREALRLIGYAHSSLSKWRLDEEFVAIEARLPEFRQQLSMEYANLEFVRNYRLVLEKDYRVLIQSLKSKEVLTDQEQAYLLKMRSHYTPQQLQIIEALLGSDGKGLGDAMDFTELVLAAERVKERMVEKIVIVGKKTSQLTEGDDG